MWFFSLFQYVSWMMVLEPLNSLLFIVTPSSDYLFHFHHTTLNIAPKGHRLLPWQVPTCPVRTIMIDNPILTSLFRFILTFDISKQKEYWYRNCVRLLIVKRLLFLWKSRASVSPKYKFETELVLYRLHTYFCRFSNISRLGPSSGLNLYLIETEHHNLTRQN